MLSEKTVGLEVLGIGMRTFSAFRDEHHPNLSPSPQNVAYSNAVYLGLGCMTPLPPVEAAQIDAHLKRP